MTIHITSERKNWTASYSQKGHCCSRMAGAARRTNLIVEATRSKRSIQAISAAELSVEPTSRFITTEAHDDGRGGVEIGVSLTADAPPGSHLGQLALHLTGCAYDVVVPIGGEIVNPVAVVPSTVFLRRDDTTGRYPPVDLLVLDRTDNTDLDKSTVAILDPAAGITIQQLTATGVGRARGRLLVDGGLALAAGSFTVYGVLVDKMNGPRSGSFTFTIVVH